MKKAISVYRSILVDEIRIDTLFYGQNNRAILLEIIEKQLSNGEPEEVRYFLEVLYNASHTFRYYIGLSFDVFARECVQKLISHCIETKNRNLYSIFIDVFSSTLQYPDILSNFIRVHCLSLFSKPSLSPHIEFFIGSYFAALDFRKIEVYLEFILDLGLKNYKAAKYLLSLLIHPVHIIRFESYHLLIKNPILVKLIYSENHNAKFIFHFPHLQLISNHFNRGNYTLDEILAFYKNMIEHRGVETIRQVKALISLCNKFRNGAVATFNKKIARSGFKVELKKSEVNMHLNAHAPNFIPTVVFYPCKIKEVFIFHLYLEKLHKIYLNYKSLENEFEAHEEDAMDSFRVNKARFHIENRLVGLFERQIQNAGGVKAILYSLKRRLLEHVHLDAHTSGLPCAQKLISLIGNYRERIINNSLSDKRMKQFIKYIASTNDICSFVAWRCFDKNSKISGFTNVFVSDIPSFDMLAAILFLATKDNSEAFADFLFYMAQIQRGNNDSDIGMDKPSCPDGTYTRSILALQKTPYALPKMSDEIMFDKVNFLINKGFREQLEKMPTHHKKLDLFDALTGLHTDFTDKLIKEQKIQQILKGYRHIDLSNSKGYFLRHFGLRQGFIYRHFTAGREVVYNNIIKEMDYEGVDTQNDALLKAAFNYAIYALTSHSNFQNLLDIFNAHMRSLEPPKTNPATMTHSRNDLVDEIDAPKDVNPYLLMPLTHWNTRFMGKPQMAYHFMAVCFIKHHLFKKAYEGKNFQEDVDKTKDWVDELYPNLRDAFVTEQQLNASEFLFTESLVEQFFSFVRTHKFLPKEGAYQPNEQEAIFLHSLTFSTFSEKRKYDGQPSETKDSHQSQQPNSESGTEVNRVVRDNNKRLRIL